MRIRSIASGSRGNAYLVEQGDAVVLIDCGVSYKCLQTTFDVSRLKAVLITHNHADHVGGLKRLLNRVSVPVYANEMTAETVSRDLDLDDSAFVCFENGQEFEVGDLSVLPFSIPHDAADPVGYLIRGDWTYFHGTDIGTPLDSVGVKLGAADYATLESNHDAVMLRQSTRPPSLIQRIAGPRGHLSNDQACELVRKFASPRLKGLALAHLSRDCNAPHLAERLMHETLEALRRTDIELKVCPPDVPVGFEA